MKKRIIIRTSDDVRPNVFKLHFQCFMQHLCEFNLFHKESISTKQLWQTLIEDGKHELVKTLQHVENKEQGYDSIVVPRCGFSTKSYIHNMVLDWLIERNINVVNVEQEITCLEKSLHPEDK